MLERNFFSWKGGELRGESLDWTTTRKETNSTWLNQKTEEESENEGPFEGEEVWKRSNT